MIASRLYLNLIKNLFVGYKESALNLLLVLLFSSYTVNHYSPEFLNADVLINSIMSLQHVTLFYWGQDRLVNILPFLASCIKNPQANLYFVLLFAAIFHFTLLLLISKTASRLSSEKDKNYSTTIFIALSVLFLLIFNARDVFSIAIWHFEYSAAFLMILLVFLRTLYIEKLSLFDAAFHVLLIFIATGINYSVLILSLAMLISVWFYRKSINKTLIVFLLASVLSFIFWSFISKKYGVGGNDYTKFNFGELNLAIPIVVNGILQTFKPLQILLIFIILTAFRFLYRDKLDIQLADKYKRNSFIFICIFGFCLGWLILFSSTNWVKLNQYHYRYFIVTFYCLFFYFAYYLAQAIAQLSRTIRICIVLLTLALLSLQTAKAFTPLHEFAIFKKLESYPISEYKLFAGDYWTVWPAVLNRMLKGDEVYGLTSRAEGNKNKINTYLTSVTKLDGDFKVLCMNEKVSVCSNQINSFLGPNLIVDFKAIGNNSSGLIVSNNNIGKRQSSESNEVLTPEEFTRISLSLESRVNFQDSLFVTIKIQNNNQRKIAAYSKLGKPIRLSWRIVDSYNHLKTDFEPRLDLPFDIPANKSVNVQVMVEKNKLSAGDHVEFSLVQELVFWTHDLGIKPLAVAY